MIDHDIHGVAKLGKIFDDYPQQLLGSGSTHARQNHQAGMNILHGDKGSKVARILRHQDEIAIDTPG